MPIEAGQHLLHYRLVEPVGEGGMGAVWKAVDTALDREVAIKVLPEALTADAERRARFEREAKTLAALNHPNIATVHGLHVQDDLVFLAMELVPGEDLAARIARGPLPVDEALDIVAGIADALTAAHDQGIVHRDLKPANVVLTPEGAVKVLDFGLAKILAPDTGDAGGDSAASPTITSLDTQVGMILGTAAYMAPEQARGRAVDKRADLWALGVVLHEMLTGDWLFHGETVSDTLAAVLRAEVDHDALPTGVPATVRRVLRRCLERDPARRLRDASEVRFAVEEARTGGVAAEQSAPVAAPRSRALLWILPLLALAIGLVIGLVLTRTEPPAPQVVRASIPPPEGTYYFLGSRQPGPPVLSPDGTRMAFVARQVEHGIRLWVKRLDREDAVPIEGTDGASYPFWSPDGRHIGFFADRMLKRVPAEGGAVLTLAEAPFGKGGAWNQDGQIVFTPSYNTPLQVVSQDGGTPRTLTEMDTDAAENSHRFPSFLPDGRRLLYLARTTDESVTGSRVRAVDLDGIDLGIVMEARAQAEYRAGHLLYVRDGALLARPFDEAALQFEGEPFVVATDVDIVAGASRAVFSASDNGTLIVLPENRRDGNRMVWLDRTGAPAGKPLPQMYGATISPDGTRVASYRDGDIWVVDIERGTQRRVTFERHDAMEPVWTPDGRTLIYRTRVERFMDIYAKAADGSGEQRLLVASDVDDIPNDVSPDGRHLVYVTTPGVGSTTVLDLTVLPLEGEGEPRPFLVTRDIEEAAQFSPDSRFLAYQSNETGEQQVFVASFPKADVRVQVSTRGGTRPRWSDDGRELYFLSPRDEMMAAPVEISSDGKVDVGTAEVLFSLSTPAYGNYDVYDGRFLVETDAGAVGAALQLVLGWSGLGG